MAISIRIEPEIEQRLDHLAVKTLRSKSYFLRELIKGGLDELEDFYLADAFMQRVRKGTIQLLTSEQVRNNLELDH